ncbi:MAG: hypothetical protein ACC633_03795 [Anaerolineales bacterium]
MRKLIVTERVIISLLVLFLLVLPISGSNLDPTRESEQIRAYSRIYEFDYVSWTISALARKFVQAGLDVGRYLPNQEKHDLVIEYLDLSNQANQLRGQLSNLIAAPDRKDQGELESDLRDKLIEKTSQRSDLAPFVEQILQDQINTALVDLELSLGGQLVPPVLYRSDPNSYALIVSPREEIRQAANLMLVRGMTLDEIVGLEVAIEDNLDLSALVVGIGGVGLYPSMIIESPNLDWLIHVISHEWTHNYLTIRPLGANYNSSPELTTINETIADLSADDIQRRTFQLFYPEYLPPEGETNGPAPQSDSETVRESAPDLEIPVQVQPFDFREQMHITRLEVDRLLADGLIGEAEAYMEMRRGLFWDNGYQIRKLNQAYFAFHGSYAADPGGAANQEGADLGSLLRQLKASSSSYRDFMLQVAWKWRLDQFEELFEGMD